MINILYLLFSFLLISSVSLICRPISKICLRFKFTTSAVWFLFQTFKEFTVSLFKRAIRKHCLLACSEKIIRRILYEIRLQNQILLCISAVLCKNLVTCTSEMFVVTFVLSLICFVCQLNVLNICIWVFPFHAIRPIHKK